MADANTDIETTTVLRILADADRRRLLRLLTDAGGPVPVERIADSIDAGHAETEVCDYGRISLHHTHLPMLREAAVVEYDADRGTVDYRTTPLLEDVLAVCSDV